MDTCVCFVDHSLPKGEGNQTFFNPSAVNHCQLHINQKEKNLLEILTEVFDENKYFLSCPSIVPAMQFPK